MEIFNYLVEFMRTLVTYAFNFTDMVGFPSYGVAIIIITVIIKAILAPLTVKQIKSMKAMQELQPRMKELQEKYKNDPQRLQAEMGAMYKEMGLSTWLMSRQTGMGASGAAAQQQKIMQIFMPLFIGYISLNFPSGLVIYWIVSNVFQLVQQHFIYKGLEANK